MQIDSVAIIGALGAVAATLLGNLIVLIKFLHASNVSTSSKEYRELHADIAGLRQENSDLRAAYQGEIARLRATYEDEISRLGDRVRSLEVALVDTQRKLIAAYKYITTLVKCLGDRGLPIPSDENGKPGT